MHENKLMDFTLTKFNSYAFLNTCIFFDVFFIFKNNPRKNFPGKTKKTCSSPVCFNLFMNFLNFKNINTPECFNF